jgi:YHS domain-containing protein
VAFVQGPEIYLNQMGITLSCAVHADQSSLLDAQHRARVNYEVFYFSSDQALADFVSDPVRYVGRVTDPVTRHRFEPTASSPTRSYDGRLFYFETAENRTTFDGDPGMYGKPRTGMQTKEN